MAVPKKRVSSSRTGMRRSHLQLKLTNINLCVNCHQIKLSHIVCDSCKTYRSRFYGKKQELAHMGTSENITGEVLKTEVDNSTAQEIINEKS